jgi:alanine racemase
MTDPLSAFNTCLVDLGALTRNYKRIASYSKSQVMGVIKGDAYGHGLIPCGQALVEAGCGNLGVLDLEEALALKRHGLPADIHVLAGLNGPSQSLRAVEAGLIVMAYDLGQLKTLDKAAEYLDTKARVRIKIDTGMGRLGFPWEKASYTISGLTALKNLQIEGLATHLATNGDQGALEQLERLADLAQKTNKHLKLPLKLSTLASGGLLAHSDFPDDLSRVGLLLYGYTPISPSEEALSRQKKAKNLIKSLEPVMTVKSSLIQVREAKAGETISYDRTFKATKTMRLGTVPIGYVHGLSRTRSGIGHALISGQKVKLLGRICMNLTMYDLTGNSAKLGDEVVILGRQGDNYIGADLASSWQKTSPYELLCLLGHLSPRSYTGFGGTAPADTGP